MKIQLVKIGKPKKKEINSLIEDYRKRLRSFAKIESYEYKDLVPPITNGGADKTIRSTKKSPADVIADYKKTPADIIVALDERGKKWTSPELADFIKSRTDDRKVNCITFVVGGPYGLGDKARDKADVLWSLSPAVFPSELAWLLVWEQIYRAYNIIKGTPYHHV